MAVDKAMSSEMFKRNFIESYVDSLDLNDSTEENHLMNLRRTEAQTIADDIVLATDAMLKQSGLKDRGFAFAVLNRKLEEEGYTRLVSGKGTANLGHISSILKKEIAQQVEVQRRQEIENSKNISEKNFEQALMSEEQVKAKIDEMDFSKLSIYDIRLIQSNLDFALKNMDDEQIEGFTKEVFRNQDESKQEENTNVIKILKKKAMGEELSEEDQAVIETIARSRNVSPETFLEDFKAVTKFDLEISNRLETKIKSIADEDGEITEEVLDAALEDLSEEEVDYIARVYGYEKKTYLITRVVQVKETIEKEQGKNIRTSEFFSVEIVDSIGVEGYVDELAETDMKLDDQDFQEVDFSDMDYMEDFGDVEVEGGYQEEYAEELDAFDSIAIETVIGNAFDASKDYYEPLQENLTNQFVEPDEVDIETADKSINQAPEEQIIPDVEPDAEIETQEEYDSKENEFEVKENPLKRFFSRIYNAIKRKDKLALDEPKEQRVEGNAKKVPIDPEKSQGYDLSDMGMVPANKIVRSNLVSLGRRFMGLFTHDNQDNENPSKGNQYIHVEDTIDKYKVNLESSGKIIPKNVGSNNKNRDESDRSNDDGLEL